MSNFETSVTSKNAIVKFFQPWCGHCKSMKPDYDKLSDEYKDSNSVLVADVNCGEEDDLCSAHDVRGYPTIKYYVNGVEEAYNGGRSYDDLKGFVQDTLEVKCDIDNSASTCSEKAIKYISKWTFKDNPSIKKEIVRLEGMTGGKMKGELKNWLVERIGILKQIQGGEEL